MKCPTLTASLDWWKFASATLAGACGVMVGIIATLIGFYFGGNFASAAQLQSETDSRTQQFARQRADILDNRAAIRDLTVLVHSLVKSQAELTGEWKQLNRRLGQE